MVVYIQIDRNQFYIGHKDSLASQVEARLKEAKEEEAVCLKALASKKKVDQLTANLKAAYTAHPGLCTQGGQA